ncbi:peroxidase family 2 domain protein [Ceratobasidium sp. AG-Ba]|nr:peroxidase family 2 domain protein [Ceratobasidium sp. AG-Ba]
MSQAPLPPAAPADQVNLDNVQGDVIMGLPKKKQEFMFFGIADPVKFKAALPSLKVASTRDVIKARDVRKAPKSARASYNRLQPPDLPKPAEVLGRCCSRWL